MEIRQARYSDESGIGKVHVDTWLTTYRGIIPEEYLAQLSYEKSIRKWKINIEKSLESSKEILLVAEEDNEIIGFCGGGLNRDEKTALSFKSDLMAIYILKDYQKKGIGKRFVFEFINQMQKLGLNSMIIWALENNSSVKFYEKLGGVKVDEKIYTFAGKKLKGIAYGWQNLDELANGIIKNGSKKYWDKEFYNSDYDYKKLASKKSWQNFIREIKDKSIKSVLDLGSGGGHWSIILSRNGVKKVKAVDISKNAINALENWAKIENLNIETEVCEIQNYSDSFKYDLIICNSVLDHLLLSDLRKTLDNISNMLDVNGYAFISFDGLEEDVSENYIPLKNEIKQYQSDDLFGMIWKYYDESEIKNLLCENFIIDKFVSTEEGRKSFWLRRILKIN